VRRGTGSSRHIGAPGQGAAEFRETPHAMRDHWLRDPDTTEARLGVRQRTTTTKHRYR
jgi:hypothetical protein